MDRKLLARRIAEESIVLLKNEDHMLPLKERKRSRFSGGRRLALYIPETDPAVQMWPDAARFWKNVKIAESDLSHF